MSITKAEKASLRSEFTNSNVQTSVVGDMQKWEETLAKQTPEKTAALKRTLLLFGSGDMQVTGTAIDNDKPVSVSASENRMPVAEYLSGHMGRAYTSLPKGQGGEVLSWISGKEGDKPGVVYPRFAATHAGTVRENGDIHEEKLSPTKAAILGVFSQIASMFSKTPRMHNGIDVAMGGEGNDYKHVKGAKIRDDGTSGHVYFNVNSGKHGDSLGCGLEGTAPGKEGPLGAHSMTGAADDYSALEGQKMAIGFSHKSAKCAGEVASQIGEIKGREGANQGAIEKLEKHCAGLEAHAKKNWFQKLFSKPEDQLDKKEFAKTCQDAGIILVEKGKKMLSGFGRQCAESGMVVQGNYNGLTMNLSNKETLDNVMAIDASKLPNEMVYYKPQASADSFVAQEPIYADIKNKPALRDNPQFGHESSVAIGTMYNVAKDNPELKPSIDETLSLLTPKNLETLGLDAKKFGAKDDMAKLTKAFMNAPQETIDKLGIKDPEAVTANLSAMQDVAEKAGQRFGKKEQYQELQQDAEDQVISLSGSKFPSNRTTAPNTPPPEKENEKQPAGKETSMSNAIQESKEVLNALKGSKSISSTNAENSELKKVGGIELGG